MNDQHHNVFGIIWPRTGIETRFVLGFGYAILL